MSATLPSGWSAATLADVADVYSGGTPSRSVPSYWGGPIPWVTTAEIDFGRIDAVRQSITKAGLDASACKIAPAGSLLIAMYGQGKTRGKVAQLCVPAATNQACAVVEVFRAVSAEYLLYFLTSQYAVMRGLSNAGGQENLSGEILKRLPISFPSDLREQDRIAAALGDADAAIAQLERLIVKKRALEQGMMQHLLTGKTRLAGFTESWTERCLGDHVTYLRTVALSRAQLDDGSPLRYLHYGDIHGSSHVALDAARTEMPRATGSLAGSAARLQVGDLVFADASEDPAGVGKSVEISSAPVDGVVPGLHTIAARFDKDYLADGFKAYLQFHPTFRTGLLRLVAGTKVLATTRSYISSIRLALPGVAEQQAIAGVLQDVGAEIELLKARLRKTREMKQGMMQELLTGRTRLPVAEPAA